VSDKSSELHIIESQLKALTNCILDKAKADPGFAEQLRTILVPRLDKEIAATAEVVKLSPEPSIQMATVKLMTDPPAKSKAPPAELSKPSRGKKKTGFNLIAYLHEQGESALREKLELESNSELAQILRSEGIRKGKFKITNRQKTIDEITQYAIRQLNQGSAFL
jgi:hypothetical protein